MKKNISLKNNLLFKKTVALYNPYLDVLGGGEKHILSILKVLSDKGMKITVFFNKNLEKEIKERFNLDFSDQIKWLSDLKNYSFFQKLLILKNFDYFFYVTDGSYFFSSAKKNYVFAMAPNKNLYQLQGLNRLKLFNFQFVSNSPFTASWLKRWGIKSTVIPPYIDDIFFNVNNKKKETLILMVGRFYSQLHNKNHFLAIKLFKKIKQKFPVFKKFKLILAGGLKKEDKDYFNNLKKITLGNSDIILKPNISFEKLLDLYGKSKYFWHFTGYGINEEKEPERAEHFGIAPLEAAASGSLVFCHQSGGPKLIFQHKVNGFLFNNEEEIIKEMINLEKNHLLVKKVINEGKKMVKENYGYQVFRNKVLKLIKN